MAAGVLLDVDGTLVDTNYQHSVAWYLAFREHGVVLPVWQIHRHVGMGGDKLVGAVAGEGVEARLGDAIRGSHDSLFAEDMLDTTSPFPGGRELIEGLKARGRPVVLASSAGQSEVDHYIDLLDVRELVDGWTTSADVEATKPEPDLVRAGLAKLGTEDAVMIGDTPWDVEAARQAGVPTIAVLSGGFSRAELTDAGAVAVSESVAELRERLGATASAA